MAMTTRQMTRSPAAHSSRSLAWVAPSRRTRPHGVAARTGSGSKVSSCERMTHNFGRIGLTGVATANPTGEDTGGEVFTQSDGGVPGGAPAPAPAPAPAAPVNDCSVRSGPCYTPTVTIPVTSSGGRERATFDLAAAFDTDAATGKKPSCCEVRQFIKWDQAFHDWMGGPPHSGFPSSTAANTWIEDRG